FVWFGLIVLALKVRASKKGREKKDPALKQQSIVSCSKSVRISSMELSSDFSMSVSLVDTSRNSFLASSTPWWQSPNRRCSSSLPSFWFHKHKHKQRLWFNSSPQTASKRRQKEKRNLGRSLRGVET